MEAEDPTLPTQPYQHDNEAQHEYWRQADREATERARRGAVGVKPSEGPYLLCGDSRNKTCQCGSVFSGDGEAYIHYPPDINVVDPVVFDDVALANSKLFAASWELLRACEAVIGRKVGAKQMCIDAVKRAYGIDLIEREEARIAALRKVRP